MADLFCGSPTHINAVCKLLREHGGELRGELYYQHDYHDIPGPFTVVHQSLILWARSGRRVAYRACKVAVCPALAGETPDFVAPRISDDAVDWTQTRVADGTGDASDGVGFVLVSFSKPHRDNRDDPEVLRRAFTTRYARGVEEADVTKIFIGEGNHARLRSITFPDIALELPPPGEPQAGGAGGVPAEGGGWVPPDEGILAQLWDSDMEELGDILDIDIEEQH